MLYQFMVDGREASPVRTSWEQASWDAVHAGYAVWTDNTKKPYSLKLDSQAEIACYVE